MHNESTGILQNENSILEVMDFLKFELHVDFSTKLKFSYSMIES